MKCILGRKKEMSQRFRADGSVCPVTAIQAGPCTVIQIKTIESDGYQAIQLGYGRKKKVSQPLRGHCRGFVEEKRGGFAHIQEFRTGTGDSGVQRGDSIESGNFKVGESVTVSGVSKGKGFTGVVKRHHFAGHPPTHGHKDQERMPGSIGAGGVQRVFKGKRMAGRMGTQCVTIKNLTIIEVDEKNGILYVSGAIPGARNSFVMVSCDGTMEFKKLTAEEKKEENNEKNKE